LASGNIIKKLLLNLLKFYIFFTYLPGRAGCYLYVDSSKRKPTWDWGDIILLDPLKQMPPKNKDWDFDFSSLTSLVVTFGLCPVSILMPFHHACLHG